MIRIKSMEKQKKTQKKHTHTTRPLWVASHAAQFVHLGYSPISIRGKL